MPWAGRPRSLLLFCTQEHDRVAFRSLSVELIAVGIKRLQVCDGLHFVPDDVVSHHAAGFFRVKRNDFKGTVLCVFKDGSDELSIELLELNGREVFIRGEVDDQVGSRGLKVFVQEFGDGRTQNW